MTNGILFNWSIALGAFSIGGWMWAMIAFLGVALVRVSLEMQHLRHEAGELRRRLLLTSGPFSLGLYDVATDSPEAPPASETRLTAPAGSGHRQASGM